MSVTFTPVRNNELRFLSASIPKIENASMTTGVYNQLNAVQYDQWQNVLLKRLRADDRRANAKQAGKLARIPNAAA